MNADWSQGSRREELLDDPSKMPLIASLSLPTGRRLRQVSERTIQIFGLVRDHTIRVPYRNLGQRREYEPWVWQSRPLNLSEIAFLVGCTRQAVLKTINKTLGLTHEKRA